jgi:signal transduction histidine kinase
VLRSPSLAGQSLPVVAVADGQREVAGAPGPNGQALVVSTSGRRLGGRPVAIAVAADFAPVEAQFAAVLSRYAQVSIAVFAMLVVLQVAIVRLALAPLARVRDDVARLERGEIRSLRETVPAEVRPLVREVNRMLALLSERLQRSRESLGNLAHALKAPLTVLTHIAGDERLRRDPQLGSAMMEQLDLLRARIDSELRRARVAGGRATEEAVDLPAEVEALAATVRKIHRERDLAVECRVDRAMRFRGDREDLLELCGNLLDNACKWARSRVVLTARVDGGAIITVEDDGPGCPPEDLARLARRGTRLDEATEGHGLGLAIARAIAASYGAELRLDRSAELGGFRATVVFPPSGGAAPA